MNWGTVQVSAVVDGNYDEKDYLFWTEKADDILYECRGDVKKARIKISEFMSEYFYENLPVTEGFYHSLLLDTLDEIDWERVVDKLIETVENLP